MAGKAEARMDTRAGARKEAALQRADQKALTRARNTMATPRTHAADAPKAQTIKNPNT